MSPQDIPGIPKPALFSILLCMLLWRSAMRRRPPRSLGISSVAAPPCHRTIGIVDSVKTTASGERASLEAYVLTVSDSCSRGEREDLSGPAVAALLSESGFTVTGHNVVADEMNLIADALRGAARPGRVLVTTGGTGLTARDVTPEATRTICSRLLDGLSEQMRMEGLKETPFAVLSRGVCGLLAVSGGEALVVNLPGAPRGAITSLRAILTVLPHALRLLIDAQAPHPLEPIRTPTLEQSS